MEQLYRYEIGQPTNGPSLSFSFPSPDQCGNKNSDSGASQGLPAFEGFYRDFITEICQKDTKPNQSDQSLDSSDEPKFPNESIMGGDKMPCPRASTPNIPLDTQTSESEHCVTMKMQSTEKEASVKETEPDKPERQEPPLKKLKGQEDKPPYTYTAMCIMAIEMSEQKALALGEIRTALQSMFPFFRGPYTGWKSSVQHCITRGKYFTQVESPTSIRSAKPWKVNHSLLKPEIFRRKNDGPMASEYKMYLHDQLSVAPVCHSGTITIPSAEGFNRIILPPATVTIDTCDSDDFLCARKESCGDNDDARSDLTSTRANSVASNWSIDSMLNKRKPDFISEPLAKKPRYMNTDNDTATKRTTGEGFDCTNISHASASHYQDNSTYNFGQHQRAYYQNFYPQMYSSQMSGYQLPNYQMPGLYPFDHTSVYSLPFYRQLYLSDPSGRYHGSHYDYHDTAQGLNFSPYAPGLQAAMNLWYYQQRRFSMMGEHEKDFSYYPCMYTQPEVPAESGMDLRVTPNKE